MRCPEQTAVKAACSKGFPDFEVAAAAVEEVEGCGRGAYVCVCVYGEEGVTAVTDASFKKSH